MTKQTWVHPQAMVQIFQPNEYVAACITGTIQCVYPGKPNAKGDNDVYDDWNRLESGWYTDSYGMYHGICGNDAKISFNGNVGSGYEYVNGSADHNRVIANIPVQEYQAGTTYYIEWTSTVGNSDTYHHKGRLVVTDVDSKHPNRS